MKAYFKDGIGIEIDSISFYPKEGCVYVKVANDYDAKVLRSQYSEDIHYILPQGNNEYLVFTYKSVIVTK